MNKVRGGAIAGGIIAAVIIGIVVALASGTFSPSDKPEISETVPVEKGGQGDTASIIDTHTINKGVDFYIDEDGKKTYVIIASDTPELSD